VVPHEPPCRLIAVARIRVRLTPRGGLDRVDGVIDGMLRVRVAAPPVDGAANEALRRLLARELDVPRRAIDVVGGASSRVKTLAIDGLDVGSLEARWPGLDVR
jgi:uncharacterized protein YggU (UPF0235/DUF167 family)